MKTLNVPFDDNEYEKLNKIKGEKSWHDFILELIEIRKRASKGVIYDAS